jgi:alpha/beta superfamily hydrolase
VSDVRHLALQTDDGLALEAEWAASADPASALSVVLCHPHPQFGGSMRSIVTSVLFEQLPAAGYPSLRFNFRGVEGSEGTYAEGELEPLDVVAAITAAAGLFPTTRIALVGWSFGADIALTVVDARVAGWVAIAPPLRFRPSYAAANDARPKHLILAEHDEFRAPAEVREEVAAWPATTVAIVPGASHFFVGRTDRVVTETRAGLEAIATTTSGSR